MARDVVPLAEVEAVGVVALHAGIEFDRGAPLGLRQLHQVPVEGLPVASRTTVVDRHEVVDVEDLPVVEVGEDVEPGRGFPRSRVPYAEEPVTLGDALLESTPELFDRDVMTEYLNDLENLVERWVPGMDLDEFGAYDSGSPSTTTSSSFSELPSPAARIASSSPVRRVR
jgi:hypothetical protein